MKNITIATLLTLTLCTNSIASETNYNAGASDNNDVSWSNCSSALMRDVCAALEAQSTEVAPVLPAGFSYFAAITVGLGIVWLRRKKRK